MNKFGILIIDDEPTIAEALTLILTDQGYEAVAVNTGSDGLELAARQSFDLIITDLRLPDMSGLEVLRALRELDGDAAVIVMTAHSAPETACELRASGALCVLKKPFLPSDLLGLIENALKERRSQPDGNRPNSVACGG